MAGTRRHSGKRDALIEALAGTTEHPSAETLYNGLKAEYPNLSLGTVYRNLSQLLQDGEIIVAARVSGQERFDFNTVQHTHFVCESCGRVEDLHAISPGEGLAERVELEYGHLVSREELTFRGICRECADNEEN